jgi:ribA/ribD-fused uncharacterized protein
MEFEFFWGTEHPFSQWHPSIFTVEGIEFNCAEQFMMYKKAMLFCDEDIATEILQAHKPSVQKQLGRLVKDFDATEWNQNRERIVYEGNFHKFTQNQALRQFLLETKDKMIAEASPLDPIWGIGMGADNPDARNPEKWKGENLLGKVLMELRADLQK